MSSRNVISALLAAFIALPTYYMFYSMFNHGFETSPFITALISGVATFVISLTISTLVSRSKQKA